MNREEILIVIGWTFLPNLGSLAGFYVIHLNAEDFVLKRPVARRFPGGSLQIAFWSVFHAGMGYATYMVFRDGGGLDGPARVPMALYLASLSYSWAWPAFFYDRLKFAMAMLDMVALCSFVGALICMYQPINETAAALALPCLLWPLCVAAYSYRMWRDSRLHPRGRF